MNSTIPRKIGSRRGAEGGVGPNHLHFRPFERGNLTYSTTDA